MNRKSALAPHAYDWVGGNFSGLQALEGECSGVAATLTAADGLLSRHVSEVVSAGGWHGAAADAFSSAWDEDSTAGGQLAEAWQRIGAIAEGLAVNLATLENALEEVAYQVEKHGVAIELANGAALPGTTASALACQSPQAAANIAKLASDYMTYRARILAAASGVRAQAGLSLGAITEALLPSQKDWGDAVNGLDAVRALWASPTTYRRRLDDKLAEAQENVDISQRACWQEALAKKSVDGNNFRISSKAVENARDALEERSILEGKLADSPPESTLTELADGDAAGLELAGVAGAVRAIPFIGATTGAAITIWQDRELGESWQESIEDGVVSNGAALGAGMGVAALIGSGSFVAVAGGVVAGGVIAIGVGDFVHNMFQENWSAEWQAHGLLDGTIDGSANAASETGHQALHLLHDIGSLF
jgi:uncharacterized protein YukE